jgi:hypothetical protein
VIVYAGTDPLTGKPRRLKETAPDRAGAQEALTRPQRQVDERQHPRSNVPVGQVISQWLDVARHEDSTHERYDRLIRCHTEPAFGAMAAGKSTTSCWSASTPGCSPAASCATAVGAPVIQRVPPIAPSIYSAPRCHYRQPRPPCTGDFTGDDLMFNYTVSWSATSTAEPRRS